VAEMGIESQAFFFRNTPNLSWKTKIPIDCVNNPTPRMTMEHEKKNSNGITTQQV
jgi:hypothetical protein